MQSGGKIAKVGQPAAKPRHHVLKTLTLESLKFRGLKLLSNVVRFGLLRGRKRLLTRGLVSFPIYCKINVFVVCKLGQAVAAPAAPAPTPTALLKLSDTEDCWLAMHN